MIDITETHDQRRERGRAAVGGNGCDEQHPAWCSPEHCYVTDEGERVHEQAPVRWEDDDAAVRVESQLLDPADDEDTYVQLSLENRLLTWAHYYGILPLEVVRRLRDQLSEHLDTAVPPDEPPDPDQLCPECSRTGGAR